MKLYQNLVLIMIKVYNDLVDSTVWTAFYTTIHINGLATAISCSKFIQGEKQDIDRSLQAIYKSFHWSKGNMNAQEKESNHTALDSAFNLQKPPVVQLDNRSREWSSLSRQIYLIFRSNTYIWWHAKRSTERKRHKMSYIRYHVPWISKADQKHLKAVSSDYSYKLGYDSTVAMQILPLPRIINLIDDKTTDLGCSL